MLLAKRKKVTEVIAAKSATSRTFIQFFFTYCFLILPIFSLTKTKPAPISPHMKPIISVPGSSYNGILCSYAVMPNLSIAASDKVTGWPSHRDVQTPRTKVATAEQKKFLHSSWKVQKVLGVEIS